MTNASPELERFINESIQRSRSKGYNPHVFVGMRERWGTKEAIRRLVSSGDIQSGFRRMVPLGLRDWTVEAAVHRFPKEFDRQVLEAAEWRLNQADQTDA